MKKLTIAFIQIILLTGFISCNKDEDTKTLTPKDPNTAEVVIVDRFSDEAGTLMKRSADASLPAANSPIDFDVAPFITKSFGPNGEFVEYYNFDVQLLNPAPIYVLFKEGEIQPVQGQLNIINVIPGDAGYNDFWLITKVTVPDDYKANSVTSFDDIIEQKYAIEATTTIVNCPVVPLGSTATKRYGDEPKVSNRGWYKGKITYYFTFEEKALETTLGGYVPLSPIYVTFNVNPNDMDPASGPPSGFVTETGTAQTHNVVATIPTDDDYSPLWIVSVYDNADFNDVSDLSSAESANILASAVANVNCPIVFVQ